MACDFQSQGIQQLQIFEVKYLPDVEFLPLLNVWFQKERREVRRQCRSAFLCIIPSSLLNSGVQFTKLFSGVTVQKVSSAQVLSHAVLCLSFWKVWSQGLIDWIKPRSRQPLMSQQHCIHPKLKLLRNLQNKEKFTF